MARLTPKHDLINPDYFKQSLYFRFLERAFERENNRKLTNFECKSVQDTLGVLIRLSKTWSNYGKNIDDSFELNKRILQDYFSKYDLKHEKFVDKYCVELYECYERWLSEMEDIELNGKDKKCNGIKDEIIEHITRLDNIKFDYIYNGYFYYKRNPSNKSKRAYVSLLNNKDVLEEYIKDFNKNNNNKYIILKMSDEVINIKKVYDAIGKISQYLSTKEYESINYIIIDMFFLNMPFHKYYYLDYIFLNFKNILELLIWHKYEEAYVSVMSFINANNKWFVRCS